MLSINGKPYDTLDSVIGLEENKSSLKSFGVKYEQIDLVNDEFDYAKIEDRVRKGGIKLIEIQRSKGYDNRSSISIERVEKVIKLIKEINKDIIIMIDNCYCEFVGEKEPLEVGADVIVGSLIKNLGGGVANNRCIYSRKKRVSRISSRTINFTRTRKRSGTVFRCK
jgi:cystathionine beta-lyase family protein involved in aluminum resistance